MSSPVRGESEMRCATLFRRLHCAADGCGSFAKSGLFCDKHRKRFERYGNVNTVRKPGRKLNLTAADGREIKRLHVGFVSTNEIARRFDISAPTVRRVLRGDYRFADEPKERADAV